MAGARPTLEDHLCQRDDPGVLSMSRGGNKPAVAVDSQRLLLILARNLITNLTLAAALLDPDGQLLFFNEAAGALVGRRFEEVGRLSREEWSRLVGPFDDEGRPVATDHLPIASALRSGRPAQGRFRLRLASEELRPVEVSALPLVEPGFLEGVLVVFWPVEQAAPGS
jgi:PAS domain-containing protein